MHSESSDYQPQPAADALQTSANISLLLNTVVEPPQPLPAETAGIAPPEHLQALLPFTPRQREFISTLQKRTNEQVWPCIRSLFAIEVAETLSGGGSVRPVINKYQRAPKQKSVRSHRKRH